ncbi:hypothetical protein D3C87_1776470 [compost metagenome]
MPGSASVTLRLLISGAMAKAVTAKSADGASGSVCSPRASTAVASASLAASGVSASEKFAWKGMQILRQMPMKAVASNGASVAAGPASENGSVTGPS